MILRRGITRHLSVVLAASFLLLCLVVGLLGIRVRQPVPRVGNDVARAFLEEQSRSPDADSLRLPSLELMTDAGRPFDVRGRRSYGAWIAQYVRSREDTQRQAGFRSCVSAAPNLVFLSFDDAPVPVVTSHILDVLARHRAYAILFVIGEYAEKNGMDALRRARTEGHVIGNHTLLHLTGSWYEDRRRLKSEVVDTEDIIGPLLGPPRLFRFPWGLANRQAVTDVEDLGYRVCGWDIDSYDWCFLDPRCPERYDDLRGSPFVQHRDVAGWSLYAVRHRGGGLLLMHNLYVTAAALDLILDGLSRPERYWRSLTQARRDEYMQYYAKMNVPPDTRFTIGNPHSIQ